MRLMSERGRAVRARRRRDVGRTGRLGLVVLGLGLALGAAAPAAPAQETADLYRRTPHTGDDPFAGLVQGRPSLRMTSRASGGNNTLDMEGMGAILFLSERDSLRATDALDALGLVPRGEGIRGDAAAGARFRIGVPVTGGLTLGLGVQSRAYGTFQVDDDAVALLRDGNGARSDFRLGETRGDGLLTAEIGAHGVWRPSGSSGPGASRGDGPRLAIGAGVRYARPLYYARARSLLEDEGHVHVSGDSVRARISVATDRTPSLGYEGRGILVDAMTRLEWPETGVALEASVRDLGAVRVPRLERRREDLDLSITRLDSVIDAVESLSFDVRDTVSATVSPPAIVGMTASVWSWRPLQLDGRLRVPVNGDFGRTPPSGEVMSTLRLGNVPLRAGIRLGGRQGVGGRFGIGLETRSLFVRGSAFSSGGMGARARGLGARLDVGFWF